MIDTQKIRDLFRERGFVHLKNYLDSDSLGILKDCANILEFLPDKPGKIMKYYEFSEIDDSQILNRVEQFSDSFSDVNKLFTNGAISDVVKLVTGISPSLFKEKINFKKSGGGGFNVHQDAAAFTRFIQDELIVVMIPVDKTNKSNGCLQVADNFFENKIIPHVGGTIEASHLSGIKWKNIIMNPSDILVFSSWLLHRSGRNLSKGPRRNYFVTYNDSKYGMMREEYFNFKRTHFPPMVERKTDVDYKGWTTKLAKKIL